RSPYKICELGLSSLKASKILEFPSLVSSPSLTGGGSHHKEFRIPYRDPWVKPEDDIVGNSRIP
ncbi:MAG: hypothetical protein SPE37_01245, partial [Campylobacter sp.]|nr:hypothetical protein [Campylobacter sp.]